MIHYVIYHMVSDRPGPYTVREFDCKDGQPVPTGVVRDFPSLTHARLSIPHGLERFERHLQDDLVIVESWI